jgi:PHP family Zn ribbon phosphoesterase
MKKMLTPLAAVLTAAVIASAACAAPMKSAAPKAGGKMVSLYQADKCHMYYSAAQAKKYNYACPDSHGKMRKVTVSAAVAAKGLAATNAALAPKKST